MCAYKLTEEEQKLHNFSNFLKLWGDKVYNVGERVVLFDSDNYGVISHSVC